MCAAAGAVHCISAPRRRRGKHWWPHSQVQPSQYNTNESETNETHWQCGPLHSVSFEIAHLFTHTPLSCLLSCCRCKRRNHVFVYLSACTATSQSDEGPGAHAEPQRGAPVPRYLVIAPTWSHPSASASWSVPISPTTAAAARSIGSASAAPLPSPSLGVACRVHGWVQDYRPFQRSLQTSTPRELTRPSSYLKAPHALVASRWALSVYTAAPSSAVPVSQLRVHSRGSKPVEDSQRKARCGPAPGAMGAARAIAPQARLEL